LDTCAHEATELTHHDQRYGLRHRAVPTVAHPGAKRGLIAAAALGLLLHLGAATAAEPPTGDTLRRVIEVLEQVKNRYVEPIDEDRLVSDAINGALKRLDPHSVYLNPDAYKDLQRETRGRFGGLGLEVGLDAGSVKIISVFEETPAQQAGLQPGDTILKFDEATTDGMTLEQAIKRARGEPGTQVTLTVLRKGAAQPQQLVLTRALIQTQSVRFRRLEPNFAYLRITQFQDHTAEKTVAALERAYKDMPEGVGGIVLDLRDNPGGLVRSAVAVSAAFLPQDALVVYTAGTSEQSKMRLLAKKEAYLRGEREDYLLRLPPEVKTVPVVVLVNGASASAAEIVAGALQDHKRAVVLGTQSFGKGTVQTIIPLRDHAALKLTTAYYYTPNGRAIQGKGVTPDFLVEQASSNALASARARVAALPEAPAAGAAPAGGADVAAGQLTHAINTAGAQDGQTETAAVPADADENENADYQLEQAVQLLRSLPALKRS
jgi:carboxyl-terminal processing protease